MVEEWDPNRFNHDPFGTRVANVALSVTRIATVLGGAVV
jgi:hypothetical protein